MSDAQESLKKCPLVADAPDRVEKRPVRDADEPEPKVTKKTPLVDAVRSGECVMFETIEKHGGVEYIAKHPGEDPQKVYDDLNKRFWNGKLPRFRVVYSDDDHSLEGEGTLGQTFIDRRLIVLSSFAVTYPGGLRYVILHEMVHAWTGDRHGLAFEREWDRVLKAALA